LNVAIVAPVKRNVPVPVVVTLKVPVTVVRAPEKLRLAVCEGLFHVKLTKDCARPPGALVLAAHPITEQVAPGLPEVQVAVGIVPPFALCS
jgi:hypothetical protein